MADSAASPAQALPRESLVSWPFGVYCEILPVTCLDGHIVALAPQPAAAHSQPGWWHELPSGRHPTETVVTALRREFAGVFDQAGSVVHSTSWRYEAERLVLSYLAVLQPPQPLTAAPPGFVPHPVHAGSHRTGRTSDPAAIPVMDVVMHGLRHLAMLRVSDTAVAETLSACWHQLLIEWEPLPAGLLEHCLPVIRTGRYSPAPSS